MNYLHLILKILGLFILAALERVIGLPALLIVIGIFITADAELVPKLILLALLVWLTASIFALTWVGATLLVVLGYTWFFFGNELLPSTLLRLVILGLISGLSSGLLIFHQLRLQDVIYILLVMGLVIIIVKGQRYFQIKSQRTSVRWRS